MLSESDGVSTRREVSPRGNGGLRCAIEHLRTRSAPYEVTEQSREANETNETTHHPGSDFCTCWIRVSGDATGQAASQGPGARLTTSVPSTPKSGSSAMVATEPKPTRVGGSMGFTGSCCFSGQQGRDGPALDTTREAAQLSCGWRPRAA